MQYDIKYDQSDDSAVIEVFDSDKHLVTVMMTNVERLTYNVERHDEDLLPNDLFAIAQSANDALITYLDDV